MNCKKIGRNVAAAVAFNCVPLAILIGAGPIDWLGYTACVVGATYYFTKDEK